MLVDADSNEVVVLRMSENECSHTLKLNSAKPQPPRRHNNYLYLDMGIGLVFAVDLAGQLLYGGLERSPGETGVLFAGGQ